MNAIREINPLAVKHMVNPVRVTVDGKPKKHRGRDVYLSAYDIRHQMPHPAAFQFVIR